MPDDETSSDETMTTSEVAACKRMTLGATAKWLERRGIRPVGRQPGRSGQNLYAREDITSAQGPGRGYRSDLHGPDDHHGSR